MKPTKKTEAEVLKVYDIWLQSYLNGDVTTYASFLDDEYHFIGSTNNQEFLSRKDTTKSFLNTAEKLTGKCDLRNETKTIQQFDELVFITHVFDAWFINTGNYSYYDRFRFTSTLRKSKEGWRFIYQHFSTPDSKTGQDETIGFDKINEENQELREAIKRGTVELSHKNRELEIAAALDRVLSRSLTMQSSNELLETSGVILSEINKLDISAMRVEICTIDSKTEAAEIWSRSETNKTAAKKLLGVVPKGVHPVFDNMVKA